jgi:tetratricopeptide (TPR) repeat protein
LIDAYIRCGEPDKAEKLIIELPPVSKEHPEDQWIQQTAFRLLTQIWQNKPGRVDAYITEAEAALAKTPDDVTTLDRLSEVYSNIKREPAKALPHLEKLATIRVDDKSLQYRLAALYQQTRAFDKSIDVYKKMMTMPNARKDEVHSQAFQVGMLLQQSGKKDEALQWIKNNYAKDIISPQDYSLLSMFYEQCDQKADAEAALKQFGEVAKTPNEKADARVRLAEMALRNREFDKASEAARAVLNDFKDNPNATTRANSVIKRVEAEAAAQAKAAEPKPEAPKEKPKEAPPVAPPAPTEAASKDTPAPKDPNAPPPAPPKN